MNEKNTMLVNLKRRSALLTVILLSAFFALPSFAQSPLCDSYPNDFCCEYISSVSINGVSAAGAPDATGFTSGPGYIDHTSSNLTTLVAGNTYPIAVTVKTDMAYNEYVKIWLDFNGNSDLSDTGELVYDVSQPVDGTGVFNANVTIPNDAFNGDIYIRVVMTFNATPTLCGSYQYGTTIDLKATITGGVEPRALQVGAAGTGGYTGSVVSSPAGIDTENGLESANFADGSTVTLTANPSGTAFFTGWTGDVASISNPLEVVMNEAKNITANFGPANTAPSFNNGATATLTVDENAAATSINDLLAITDTDTGNPLTWSVTTAPSNGSLGGFNATATSTGSSVTPSGLSYTPTSDYSGSDSFVIEISDGTATAQITVNVTVRASQSITFDAIGNKTYGDADFTLGDATTDKGLTVTYTASDPTIVSISGNTASILKAGSTTITASQDGDATHEREGRLCVLHCKPERRCHPCSSDSGTTNPGDCSQRTDGNKCPRSRQGLRSKHRCDNIRKHLIRSCIWR